jgi:hypothetical protein
LTVQWVASSISLDSTKDMGASHVGGNAAGGSETNPLPAPDPSASIHGNAAAAGCRSAKRSRQHSPLDDWLVGERYEIFRFLGAGSYGEVAEAVDLQ